MVINSVDFEQQSFFGRRTADGRRRTACNVDLLAEESGLVGFHPRAWTYVVHRNAAKQSSGGGWKTTYTYLEGRKLSHCTTCAQCAVRARALIVQWRRGVCR